MNQQQSALWARLKDFEIDDPEADFTFSMRLARENGWTLHFSLRVIEEYKKFLLLACTSGHPVTPSDQVDQVWHLHLIYTRSYWKVLCERILKTEIHHGPTLGGMDEGEKYQNLYQLTKESYRRIFGENPPIDIWPSNEKRFKEINFRRVNIDKNWILRNPLKK